jgi:type IV pilus assembly protein PilM
LAKLMGALGSRHKQVVLTVGATDAVLRPAELPIVPAGEMRTMVKLNAKAYLQQDLADCTFDCHVLPLRPEAVRDGAKAGQKAKVLVGAAKQSLVEQRVALARGAGLQAEALVPELICPVNAFELAEPEVFAKESVALVDLGFSRSAICLLLEGELVLSRVVAFGGDKITTGLAETLGTSYSEAEGIKVGLAHEVQGTLGPMLAPLARELRASIDFFEHQHDRAVGKVFVSGAAARSDYLLEALQSELMIPCAAWNPMSAVTAALPGEARAGLDQSAAMLCTAMGAALSYL